MQNSVWFGLTSRLDVKREKLLFRRRHFCSHGQGMPRTFFIPTATSLGHPRSWRARFTLRRGDDRWTGEAGPKTPGKEPDAAMDPYGNCR